MPPHYINTLQNNTKEDTLSFLIYFFNAYTFTHEV